MSQRHIDRHVQSLIARDIINALNVNPNEDSTFTHTTTFRALSLWYDDAPQPSATRSSQNAEQSNIV